MSLYNISWSALTKQRLSLKVSFSFLIHLFDRRKKRQYDQKRFQQFSRSISYLVFRIYDLLLICDLRDLFSCKKQEGQLVYFQD